jgi:hypothetical protein
MADNTTLPGTGETVRDKDRAGVKTQIVGLDLGIGGTETLMDGSLPTTGNVAHDAADAGNPVKMGAKAVAHGASPTAVAAGDRTDLYANRHGVLFHINGHPNIQTTVVEYTAAQTDTSLVGTIAAGTKVVVTFLGVRAANANTVFPAVRVGFGAANTPALGAAGLIDGHPGVPAGGGFNCGDGSAIQGAGGDGEEVRITSGVPTGGSIYVTLKWFTIES